MSIYGHPIFVIMTKLKMLRSFLRNWNKDTFGHVDSLIFNLVIMTKIGCPEIKIECEKSPTEGKKYHEKSIWIKNEKASEK